jgi:PadR family transcriptional regulator PadR
MPQKSPRLTPNALRVLDALLRLPRSAGADIARATGLSSGTLYPMLLRLEDAGWLSSQWEEGSAPELGRPLRRLYQVTAEGASAGSRAANDLKLLVSRLA